MFGVSRGLSLLALMLACIALLAGCGVSQSGRVIAPGASPAPTATTPTPTSLQIYRLSGPPGTNVALFEAETSHADSVQRLFAAMLALPTFIPSFTCPNDRGGGYVLTFLEQGRIVVQVFIPAGGCSLLALSKPYGCHTLPDEIMRQLAETLEVQESALGLEGEFYDTAPPGSPTAPANLRAPLLPLSACR